MIKTILISQFALPYDGIGSWTNMYNYYLENTKHNIDIIICPKPTKQFTDIKYYLTGTSFTKKVSKKINRDRYLEILNHLENIIDDNQKYIIQLVDNHGLVKPIQDLLVKKGWRKRCYLQFYYHGFSAFYGNFESRSFFESIDEHVNLTMDSYQEYKSHYTILPCKFSVLHNGIDKERFKPLSVKQKNELKKDLNVANKTVFLWCSQDRPKKGLSLMLDVWKRVFNDHKNTELWVIGAKRDVEIPGVQFFGKIPNAEIAKYYQASDVYVYPSLCQEGFGLSLIEALACGNLCIASNNGGIPEVLEYGAKGILIENPNFIEEWVQEINKLLIQDNISAKAAEFNLSTETYSIVNWSEEMNKKIENAKMSLSN